MSLRQDRYSGQRLQQSPLRFSAVASSLLPPPQPAVATPPDSHFTKRSVVVVDRQLVFLECESLIMIFSVCSKACFITFCSVWGGEKKTHWCRGKHKTRQVWVCVRWCSAVRSPDEYAFILPQKRSRVVVIMSFGFPFVCYVPTTPTMSPNANKSFLREKTTTSQEPSQLFVITSTHTATQVT